MVKTYVVCYKARDSKEKRRSISDAIIEVEEAASAACADGTLFNYVVGIIHADGKGNRVCSEFPEKNKANARIMKKIENELTPEIMDDLKLRSKGTNMAVCFTDGTFFIAIAL